jgi:hypothetical protein
LFRPRTQLTAADDGYIPPFARGFLIAKERDGRVPSSWRSTTLGHFTLRTDPSEELWVDQSGDAHQAVFIGTPVDLVRPNDSGARIARRTTTALQKGGIQGLLDQVAPLGGRFVMVARRQEAIYIVPDCAATVPIFWHGDGSSIIVGSHAKLVAEVAEADTDEATARLVNLRRTLNPRYTVHQPALLTHYEGVRPVLANCILEIDTSRGTARHRRFYPMRPIEARDFEHAYSVFEETLRVHVAALSKRHKVGVSLTAGLDSRTTFAAARQVKRADDLFTFTYLNFDTAGEAEIQDMMIANRLAHERRISHLILRTDVPDNPDFDRTYAATFGKAGQARKIAQALYEQLPSSFTELMSNVAEIGSAFYKNRNADLKQPKALAAIYGHSEEFGGEPAAVDAFQDYLEYNQLEMAADKGIDLYDLFYWEHRLSRWAAIRFQEAQLGHQVMLPFNARPVVEAMLSGPLADRLAKRFQRNFVERYE